MSCITRITDKITPITNDMMRIDTNTQTIDMQQIDNRYFMYNPKTGVLVLGPQDAEITAEIVCNAGNAQELAEAGITKNYDDFVRGWVGVGGDYPMGVIHFAPCVYSMEGIHFAPCLGEGNITLLSRAFHTLEMFWKNGALSETVVRGFGEPWEQPLGSILSFPLRGLLNVDGAEESQRKSARDSGGKCRKKAKKEYIESHKPFAYYHGLNSNGGVEIYGIEHGAEDYVYCVSNCFSGMPLEYHRLKVHYCGYFSYIVLHGCRIRLADFLMW